MPKIAVQGCVHGDMDRCYLALPQDIDVVVWSGDVQTVRDADDLNSLACPAKYRKMLDFHGYFNGLRQAPMLTLFIGGNHEASSFLRQLPFGGWVAPNMFYLGFSGVLNLVSGVGSPVRVAGLSGIFNHHHYEDGHFEQPPFNQDTVRSVYHVRRQEVDKLCSVRTAVDLLLTHDWPSDLIKMSTESAKKRRELIKKKPFFEGDLSRECLGNPHTSALMRPLKPKIWAAAHLHVNFNCWIRSAEPPPKIDQLKNAATFTVGLDDSDSRSLAPSHSCEGALLNPTLEATHSDEVQIEGTTKEATHDGVSPSLEIDLSSKASPEGPEKHGETSERGQSPPDATQSDSYPVRPAVDIIELSEEPTDPGFEVSTDSPNDGQNHRLPSAEASEAVDECPQVLFISHDKPKRVVATSIWDTEKEELLVVNTSRPIFLPRHNHAAAVDLDDEDDAKRRRVSSEVKIHIDLEWLIILKRTYKTYEVSTRQRKLFVSDLDIGVTSAAASRDEVRNLLKAIAATGAVVSPPLDLDTAEANQVTHIPLPELAEHTIPYPTHLDHRHPEAQTAWWTSIIVKSAVQPTPGLTQPPRLNILKRVVDAGGSSQRGVSPPGRYVQIVNRTS